MRSRLDAVSVVVYRGVKSSGRTVVVLLSLLIFAAQLAFTGYALLAEPSLGVVTLLSVVPALLLAGYVWYEDVTSREPLSLLLVTFLFGVLFAGFAAVVDSVLQIGFELIPVVGMALFFYLAVGPIEETVKWLAVRLYAYRSDRFDAVIDGAVYGAVAGLGFATVENSLYISQQYLTAVQAGTQPFQTVFFTAGQRALVGPGHVIYSAFAGYYLGLAKFNREHAGPIVVKGLLVAAFIHGTYDTLVTYLPLTPVGFLGFVIVYDGFWGYVLYRKLARYRRTYRRAMKGTGEAADASVDQESVPEFER